MNILQSKHQSDIKRHQRSLSPLLTFLCLAIFALPCLTTQTLHISSAKDSALSALAFSQQTRLTTEVAGDGFANRAAISLDTAVVTSSDGAYVYVRSGSSWSKQAFLVPSDGASVFGPSPPRVAINADTIALSGGFATINGNTNQGAVYVFVRNGTTWTQQQRLTASDGTAGDFFGAVAISGNTIVVGAPAKDVGANIDQGAAYVYTRDGSVWTEQQKLLAPDGDHNNAFGRVVSIDGDTIAASRARHPNATIVDPAVYVFIRNGTSWQHQQRLSVCEPSASNFCAFGDNIAVRGNLLAVANWALNEQASTAVGGVYIFERASGVWNQVQKLLPDVIATNSEYGNSVSLDGQTLSVGATSDFSGPGAGSAYLYTRPATQWIQQQKLQVPGHSYFDAFGAAVGVDGNTLIVAASRDNGAVPYIGAAYVFTDAAATPTPTPTPPVIQFSQSSFSVNEGGGDLTVTVTRTGDTTSTSTVDYASTDAAAAQNCNTVDGNASSRCDYITTLGTLHFAAGETLKTISIPIIDDVRAEGAETFTITLSNTSAATLGSPAAATLTIDDNDSVNGTTNPIDSAGFFVRQHYIDFLNREPDAGGLAFWTNEITQCGTDQACIDLKRINVSAAFFLSIEFQNTGYLVERLYKAAYGDGTGTSTVGGSHQLAVPIVRFNEFLRDTQTIGQGVVVGQVGWEQALENNKVAFITEFVSRSRFTTAFTSSLTSAQFVDTLNNNAQDVNGLKPLSQSERDALVNDLNIGAKTRPQVLRSVAEHQNLQSSEFNRGFVLMQYFGYLRRNPNDPQDSDYTGYDFWLRKLNDFNGNFVNAEMVKAFLTSTEYRVRFG